MRAVLVFSAALLVAHAALDGDDCLNGGKLEVPEDPYCTCKDNWTGVYCDVQCSHDGKQKLLNGDGSKSDGKTCTCETDTNWDGDFCLDIKCDSKGKSNDDKDKCICDAGSIGQFCEIDSGCKNGGVLPTDGSTSCSCPSYWTGYTCDEIVCVNGGFVTDLKDLIDPLIPEVFRKGCHCPKGYYGIHCDAVKTARPVEEAFVTKDTFNLYIHNELTDWYGFTAFQRIQRDITSILKDYTYDSYNLFQSYKKFSDDGKTFEPKFEATPFTEQKAFTDAVEALNGARTRRYTCDQTVIFYGDLLNTLKGSGIEDSTVLMFTQYPPTSNDEELANLAALKEYCRAFRIKLNVLIGADDILLDCDSPKNKNAFDELIGLAHFTDGEAASFLIEDETSDDELLPTFIASSARPQSHSRAASEDCSNAATNGIELVFQTDPYPNDYFIAVRTEEGKTAAITGTCSSGGEISLASYSFYKEFTLVSILSGAQQTCTLAVKAASGCLATVYSVGGKPDVDSFDLFHSYATSDDMDSDSILSYKNEEYFVTLHIEISDTPKYQIVGFEGVAIVKNEDEQVVMERNLVNRGSTFEYISDKAFKCPAEGDSWIQLKLNGLTVKNEVVAVLDRMVPLNCEDRTPLDGRSRRLFRSQADEEEIAKPALAILYSNWLPNSQFSKFILESVADEMEGRFSQFGYLRFDTSDPEFKLFPAEKYADFKKDVYDHAPDSGSPYNFDNIEIGLQELTKTGNSITSDSLVTIGIQHSLTKLNDNATNYAQLANMGAKLVFWGDTSTVKIIENTDTIDFYTRYAAMSAGHVIFTDMIELSDNDEDFYVELALRDMYTSGPSQRLLSFSNLEWEPSANTIATSDLAAVQVPASTGSIFVSLTLNVKNPTDIIAPFMLSLALDNGAERIVVNLADFTSYCPDPPLPCKSNLYTKKITGLSGGSYASTLTVLAMTSFTGAHVRFWTDRTKDDIIPELKYVDFGMNMIQPNDFLGAALHVPGESGATMSLRFLDENGKQAVLNDNSQTVDVVDGVAHFVPFFCQSEQSLHIARDMYTVEITYDSGFKYVRPLLCSVGAKPSDDCHDDSKGDYYCTETNPPFHRGPSQKLLDCSGVGTVVYNAVSDPDMYNYRCECQEGFTGKSCEQSSCAADIVHLPGERDTAYRTLSFVFVGPAGAEACTDMAAFYSKDAKNLFKEVASYDNIWQYSFSVYFTDGTAKTLYRGPSYTEFYQQFDKISDENEKFDTDRFCGNASAAVPMDMSEVFNLAVESVGRNSRGVVLLHASQSFYAQDNNNELLKIVVDNTFYQAVQAYQQQIFMVTPTLTKDIVDLTTASGGVAVKILNDFDTYDTTKTRFAEVFGGILTAEIGWAGVLTATTDTPKKWTFTENAELFIISQFDTEDPQEPLPDITTCDTTPVAVTELEQFPSDDVDDDKSLSQHATIPVTPGESRCLQMEFKAAGKYPLVQIVILTKKNPVTHALLGQGQANADKFSAGATNSSERAAHISFDRLDVEAKIVPIDPNWRQAARINCTFAQEFVDVGRPFADIGPSIVEFTVQSLKDGDDGNVVSDGDKFDIAIPIVVTEEIACVHGTFDSMGSFCDCDRVDPADKKSAALWSGPTCSQPTCGDGRLNAHGDHCDCTGAKAGGLFCQG